MNLEQSLVDELAAVAGSLDVPPPPAAAALAHEAEHARARSRVRWAGTALLTAAAVTAAIVGGARVGRPDATPSPAGPTSTTTARAFPVGAPLRTYVDPTNGTLYLDGQAESGRWSDATTIGDLTIAYARTALPGGDEVGVFRGHRRVGVLHGVAGHEVEVSPHARTLAWVEDHGATGVLVVAETTDAGVHELGRLSVPALGSKAAGESAERVMRVADDGTATYGGVTGGHSWRPGEAPRPADLSSILYGPAGFPSRAEDVHLDPSGSWGAWLTDPRDPGTGGGFASWASVTFQQPGKPATRATIRMPARLSDVRTLSWESDTDLVLGISDGNPSVELVTSYVRCHVVDRSCEVAPGWSDH